MPYPACSNCGTTNWGAKNDNFCNMCEREWYRVLGLIFRPDRDGPNPEQGLADAILRSVQHGEKLVL